MFNPKPRNVPSPRVYVWDPFVRLIHWTLVLAFTVAYLTEDDWLTVHVWAGYLVGGLIVARIVWAFVGPAHAASPISHTPAKTFRYVRGLLPFRAARYLGHSPGGGAMVLLLLVLLARDLATGLVVYSPLGLPSWPRFHR